MRTAETPPPTLCAARAAVFAAVCVLVAAVGHDAFSVGAIPVRALLVGGGVTFLVVRPLTLRERGLPTILMLMGGVQVGLHQLFGGAQRGGGLSLAMASPPRGAFWCGHSEPAGVSQAVHNVVGGGIGVGGGGGPSQHSMSAGMWAAHVVAALVAAWWLRRGEVAVWSLARALGLALIMPLVLLAAVLVAWTPTRRAAAVAATVAPARLGPGWLLRFGLARRGPPTVAAAFA